jgi:hypothetical protein
MRKHPPDISELRWCAYHVLTPVVRFLPQSLAKSSASRASMGCSRVAKQFDATRIKGWSRCGSDFHSCVGSHCVPSVLKMNLSLMCEKTGAMFYLSPRARARFPVYFMVHDQSQSRSKCHDWSDSIMIPCQPQTGFVSWDSIQRTLPRLKLIVPFLG